MSQLLEETEPALRPTPASRTSRVTEFWRKLRTPADGDRGAQRWRKIFISLGGAVGSRALAFGCNLLMIPLALRYLGVERYGVWMTLTSAVTLLAFFDFGLGIGLQNRVAEMMGKDELGRLPHCVRSTLLVLSALSLGLFALLLGGLFGTDIAPRLFRDGAFAAIDLRPVLALIAGAFVLGLPLSLFPRIAFGLQQGWIASTAQSCGTALSLAAVFLASHLQVGFTAFVAFTVVPPVAAQLVALVLLARRLPGGLPLFGSASLPEGLGTLRRGSHYVLPQVAGAILTQGPMVFLGTRSSAVDAAVYNILSRISAPVQQLQQMFLVQVWPAITEAMHRGDTGWLRTTLRRILRLNLAVGAGAIALVSTAVLLLYPLLARSEVARPSVAVILLFAVHVGIMCVVQGLAYMANGLSRMRLQNYLAVLSVIFAVTILPFAAGGHGITGVLVAMLALNVLVTLPLLYREYSSYLAGQTAR